MKQTLVSKTNGTHTLMHFSTKTYIRLLAIVVWLLSSSWKAAYTCNLLSAVNSSVSIITMPHGCIQSSTPGVESVHLEVLCLCNMTVYIAMPKCMHILYLSAGATTVSCNKS